ncbi:ABC transporter permease [Dyadobacter sp. LJ53]|uniref:ABC transporter permease n=1 Tax=Dyadobacter chenwenxiniae TaxID=2906456 RepID=UPI001F37A170|nr:ABC transporter permease [Dyadobacter chenwenxiniae]MCF0049789.1 ABC transporter permease [Dyadobacter chenwenxiniae]
MIKNYLKIAFRNLVKNKVYSAINIGGLAVGMGVAMLVGLWVADEISYNTYFKNSDRLAQVMVNQTFEGVVYTGGTVAMPTGDALRTQFKSDFKRVSLTSFTNEHTLATGEKKLRTNGRWVQADFPQMFTFKMLKGSMGSLKDPTSVLITHSLATALFGSKEPLNQIIRIDNKLDMKVAGVYEDLPRNTTFFDTKILLPWNNSENWLSKQVWWDSHDGQLFVEMADRADIEQASEKVRSLPTPHVKDLKEELLLHPMAKLHLYDEFENGKAAGGHIQFVWLVGVIGVFVLLLACINFMNLSTARNEKRAKEVGIRKAIGSLRTQLILQFLSESMIVAFLAFVLALMLTNASFPFFNRLADKQMSIPWNSAAFWLLALGFTVFTGLVSGSYPALYLASFEPVKVLKGVFRVGRFATMPRKVLVVIQFTVSITLIIGTIVVYRQIQFAKNRTVGYTRDKLITLPLTVGLYGHYEALRNDLLQTQAVENMAESSQTPAFFSNNNSVEWRGKDPKQPTFFRDVNVTRDFGKTIGWHITKGRDFSAAFPADSLSVIMNETALKTTGLKNPIGEVVKYAGRDYTVVGIVKDMITQSPYAKTEPTVFFGSGWMSVITVRLANGIPAQEALEKVQAVFKKHDPDSPFEYKFLDQEYARKFSNEAKIGNLTTFFAMLAIFISCLGLFGLASYVAEQRTKEIGIRKVLGASVANLWQLLSQDFLGLVIISCVISVPLAWYFLDGWLQKYEYRTPISWWIFAVAGLGVLVIALFTVSYQAIRAALLNPVKSLKVD